jgi:hypothetical protein
MSLVDGFVLFIHPGVGCQRALVLAQVHDPSSMAFPK